jgi:hypothetical protein
MIPTKAVRKYSTTRRVRDRWIAVPLSWSRQCGHRGTRSDEMRDAATYHRQRPFQRQGYDAEEQREDLKEGDVDCDEDERGGVAPGTALSAW